MNLNNRNHVLGTQMVYKGSVNMAQVRVGELFKQAVRQNATSILVCHNHPSSQVEPSPDDILLTRHIVEAGKLLEIDVLDHLICSKGRWLSLRERGLGFS
jgi:DNA repair protein RadC